jgi:hypothetical protein
VGISVLSLAVLWALSMGTAAQARTTGDAPGFSSGPRFVSGGLLWSGLKGVSLSTAAGTRLLVPGAELSAVLVEDGWTVRVEPTRLEVGRTGGRLAPVRALRRCRAGTPEDWLDALAGGNLYTIVRASCISQRAGNAQFLVRVRLGSGALHAIARVPSGALALVAAGRRLALTYKSSGGPAGRVRVEILDASSARLLYSVTAPPSTNLNRYGETQMDSAGDVLVSGFQLIPPPGPAVAFAWWGNARTRVGRALGPTASVAAALSDGHIAYATNRGGVEHIDLLSLATRKTRTMVTFPGSARVEGVGLDNTRLAWAQQSYGYTTQGSGCASLDAVGSAELAETSLSSSGPPVVVKGVPVPPAPTGPGRICIEM